VEGDPGKGPEDHRAIRACLRGRAYRELLNSPDRLAYPMKRIGPRGSGKFQPISWDRAWDEIAQALKDTLEGYGNQAVYRMYGSGAESSVMERRGSFPRLMNLLGGFLEGYNSYSSAQVGAAGPFLYGRNASNTITDIANTRLLLMFGDNTLETKAGGGGASFDLFMALKKSQARVISVDPRLSDTAALLAHRWIPIRPGTDGALAMAMNYVLVKEDLIDKSFLASHVLGFDDPFLPSSGRFKDYILGNSGDRTPKTPYWAQEITGCPAEDITELARELGKAKPAFVTQGLGPQRQAFGEATSLAIMSLAVLSGNVGLSGGNTGLMAGSWGLPFPGFPEGLNGLRERIPVFAWARAVKDVLTWKDDGLQGGQRLAQGIKFIWNAASDIPQNQHADLNGASRILSDRSLCPTVVTVDVRLTPTAMMSDYVLPAVLPPENQDIYNQGWGMARGFFLVTKKALPAPGEALPQYDIVAGLSERFGLRERFTMGLSQTGWVENIYRASRLVAEELPESMEEAIEHGPYSWHPKAPIVAFRAFREDPARFPLETPSGKIELYSDRLAKISQAFSLPEGEGIGPIPEYRESWEGPKAPLAKKYPLQLIGHHYKGRVHSSFAGLPSLERLAPQTLWINPLDAEARGLSHGDAARIWNDRGATLARVKVTSRIMPGVVSLPQGAWYRPRPDGTDEGGSVNVLTRDHPSPLAKGNPQHTNLVEVKPEGRGLGLEA
jgi:DmsA/YnfE family anaerobic dimethyl sulfoxide reductase A subunit